MGFLTTPRPGQPTTPQSPGAVEGAYVAPEVDYSPTFADIVSAFKEREFTPGSLGVAAEDWWNLYASRNAMTGEGEMPGYDALEDGQIMGYEDYASAFINSRSPAETRLIRESIDRERRNTETIAESGWTGTGVGLATGILDPVNLLPLGWTAKSIRAGKVARDALLGAGAGFTSGTLGEGILQSTQRTRPSEESLINVAAMTLLGGALGGGIGYLTRSEAEGLAATFKDEVIEANRIYSGSGDTLGTGGASAVRRTTSEQESLADSLNIANLGAGSESTIVGNPLSRLATSPSIESRRVGRELAEQPYIYKGEQEGIAAPHAVDTRIKSWDGPLSRAIDDIDEAFLEHRFGGYRPFGRARSGLQDIMGQRPAHKLTYEQFKERVALAARRGDEDAIPEVARAAKAARKFFDELKDEAIALKLLPKDVTPETAVSYVTRVYLTRKIAQQRPKFERTLVEWLATHKDLEELSPSDLFDIAADITDKILGNNGVGIFQPIPLKRGPLKERTLTIPDDRIEEFLDNDIERVLRIYKRTMSADVELTKAFGKADMSEAVERVRENYKRVRDGIDDPKKLELLQKRMESDIRDIEAMRDRLRGNFGMPDNPEAMLVRVGRAIRTLNYLRLGGGFTLGSIPDIGRLVMRHGMGRVMGQGIAPLIKNLAGVKLAAKEIKLAGTGLDYVLDTRAANIAEIADDFGRNSQFERGLQYAGNKFGLVNVMSVWNSTMKQWFGVMSQTRMLQAAEAIANGKGTKKELQYLAELGIDEQMAHRIHEQAARHGFADETLRWAGTENWTDREAMENLRLALIKDVDIGIVTPGQEKPLWMSTELGKIIGQFRSFTLSAMARVAARGLQQRDAAALQGLIMSVALGALAYRLKVPEEHRSDNPAMWIKEGIDRSGVTGWLFDANNIYEKATGAMGVNAALGAPASRFASRDIGGAVFGPSFGLLLDDAPKLARAIVSGKWTDSETHRLRKILPYQNVFYLRWLFDQAEDGVDTTLNVPSKRRRVND